MYKPEKVTVGVTGTLVWRTTTGVTPDPLPNASSAIYRAGAVYDPLPILVVIPATVTVYVVAATANYTTGVALPTGPYAMPFNVAGDDELYLAVAGHAPTSTTVAAGSTGVNVNTFTGSGTLHVASSASFPTTGDVTVTISGSKKKISYTGKGSGTFTGCSVLTGGAGVMATGDVVALVTTTQSIGVIVGRQ